MRRPSSPASWQQVADAPERKRRQPLAAALQLLGLLVIAGGLALVHLWLGAVALGLGLLAVGVVLEVS